MNDVGNVLAPVSNEEFPLSILDFRESWPVGSREVKNVPHLMLYLVGEELGNAGSTSAACMRSVACAVDQDQVPTLPEEVVEEVLVRLSAPGQARCRAVCKKWLALLTNPEFLRRSFLLSVSRTTPPLCAVKGCPGRDLSKPQNSFSSKRESKHLLPVLPLYKALKVDLSFLPGVFHSKYSKLIPSGLMCISRFRDHGFHVCVFNPVNQSFKVLPPLHMLWGLDVVVLMRRANATESTSSFKVYVSGLRLTPAGVASSSNVVAIYSSISDEWKGFLCRPEVEASEWLPTACNGDLYTIVESGPDPPLLVRLSTERGPRYLWDIALPCFEKRAAWPGLERVPWRTEFFLAGHRGRLLCCCGGIWMLDGDRQLWVEIAGRCPPHIMLPDNRCLWQTFVLESVHIVGDLVVFVYQLQCDRFGHQDCPVAYDMLGRCW